MRIFQSKILDSFSIYENLFAKYERVLNYEQIE